MSDILRSTGLHRCLSHSKFRQCINLFISLYLGLSILQSAIRDIPGGWAVKNLPCSADDIGSIPGWVTKVSHAVEQPSPWATATGPTHSGTQGPQLESMHRSERALITRRRCWVPVTTRAAAAKFKINFKIYIFKGTIKYWTPVNDLCAEIFRCDG